MKKSIPAQETPEKSLGLFGQNQRCLTATLDSTAFCLLFLFKHRYGKTGYADAEHTNRGTGFHLVKQ